ncbi:uncharacterized protein AB675_592 [Cyphellophora attinorum]|uniref:Uncharacterized protein n=1 Tax=Cyphellophora attinorum TaxID=1664694 RepID=A0A0N0NS67_9EURO|nr:uncharacterized protein AB675_592 [Phialophora attinorum]KPI45649.1 hypothetical protein AB675_592 [Phialophora attinorum]
MGTLISPKYPSMERQDLTQGQLGSFKFTPVDIEHEQRNNIFGETPMLWQAQAKLRARLEQQPALEGVAWDNEYPRKKNNRFDRTKGSPYGPLSHASPRFINDYISSGTEDTGVKMDVVESRSSLNCNSPERLHYVHQANYPPFYPSQPRSHLLRSAMNPEASAFDPSTASSDSGREHEDNYRLFNSSLCRALQAEQQAHEEALEQVDNVLAKLHTLEIQFKTVVSDNKSLAATIKALSAIVKHNEKKIKELEDREAAHLAGHSDKSGSMNGNVNTAAMSTGLETATKNLPNDLRGSDPSFDYDQASPLVKQVSPGSDHSRIFDLNLLDTRSSSNPQTANLSRALRKHFSVDETSSVSSTSVNITVDNEQNADELIHVSPQKPKTVSQLQADVSNTLAAEPVSTPSQSTMAKAAGKLLSTDKLWSADNEMPKLPAAFLNTYTPKRKAAPVPQEQTEMTALPDPSPKSSGPVTVKVAAPLSLSIHWKVTKENPIFDDERDWTVGFNSQPYQRNPSLDVFWKHPVRFMEYGDNDKNIFRTVMVDYIPKDATYQDVLEHIYGGSLEKVELVPAVGRESEHKTARLVFNTELGASTTANFARDYGIKIKGYPVRVWQVLTPTYPKNNQLDREVFEDAYTRILMIDKVSEQAVNSLPVKLATYKNQIVEIRYTFDHFPMVEFTSVAAATNAYRHLVRDPLFAGAEFDFDHDYCDGRGLDEVALKDLWGPEPTSQPATE